MQRSPWLSSLAAAASLSAQLVSNSLKAHSACPPASANLHPAHALAVASDRVYVTALLASELILRDVDAKGYLKIELVYRLRQKESLGSVKQKVVRKIQQNESAVCFEELVRELLEAV